MSDIFGDVIGDVSVRRRCVSEAHVVRREGVMAQRFAEASFDVSPDGARICFRCFAQMACLRVSADQPSRRVNRREKMYVLNYCYLKSWHKRSLCPST